MEEIVKQQTVRLEKPSGMSQVSVEEALSKRRSFRTYKDQALNLKDVSQLLWAAQGMSDLKGLRTAPSSGATYPLEIYLVAGNVEGLPAGVYKYKPRAHEVIKTTDGDVRDQLAKACLGQVWVQTGAISLVLSAVYDRTTSRYGKRGERYVHMEAGHAAENVHLQAVSLDLGTVIVGAFRDDEVMRAVSLEPNEEPLCVMPVGRV